jgi:hypothetical protein
MTATWLGLSVTREECSDALRDEYYSFYASWVCDLSGGDRYQGIGVFKGGYQGLLDPRTPSKAQGKCPTVRGSDAPLVSFDQGGNFLPDAGHEPDQPSHWLHTVPAATAPFNQALDVFRQGIVRPASSAAARSRPDLLEDR